MAGFYGEIMYAKNGDFSTAGSQRGLLANGLLTNGQMWIGTTAANAGGTHINVGTLTSSGGTVAITYSSPNINLEVVGGESMTNFTVDAHTGPGTNPVLPTALGNVTITGAQVAAGVVGTNVVRTDSLAANAYTIEIQRTTTAASSTVADNGVAHFDSARFTVDSNGFVSLNGSGVAETITGNSGGALNPTSGNWNILGASTAAGATPVTTAGSVSTLTVNVQKSQAIAATNASNVGLAAFDSARFTVDANGFVSVNGSGLAETITGNTGGALSPTSGNWNILGSTAAAGTTPVKTVGSVSTLTVDVQFSQAIAATDATKVGLSTFDSARFTVDANGFVSANGSGIGETITGNSGGALSPTSGNWNILGASTAAGSTPVTTSGSVSTLTVDVQKSQAIAATDATKVGLAAFDSARFSVDANGFVSLSGTGVAETITGDSGGALSPTAGNWNILGRSGSKTSGSGSTLTVKSPPYADDGSSTTSTLYSGSFVTAAITLTLPASAGLADGDLFEYVCTTAGALIIQAVGAQQIRIGSLISSAAGTATSTNVGDSVSLRFRAADGFFYATSSIGIWLMA